MQASRKRLVIGLSIAAVAVVAVVTTLFLVLGKSDEDKIRDVIHGYADAYNRSDLVAHESYWCEENSTPADKISDERKRNFGPAHLPSGRLDDLTIESVTVTGDKAHAVTVLDYAHEDPFHQDIYFVREKDDWKICGNAPDL